VTEVGRLIADRYRLTEHIGSGAMGVVWQAHDERLHRTVALKQLLLQPGLSASEAHEARERAMREGRIAARLQHPNAVAVYDVVEDAGQPVLIMEYVPSKSLSAVLDERGTLTPQEVARIGAQVATALTAAHAAGIVHRDIKPGNVLLAEDGTVKITDFGISRATGDVTVTATGMLAGTPAYLAPEVAKGENPGPPSDVFSLASTVYAAVEGQPPFGLGDNTLALLHAVAACRTIPPRKAGPLTALLMHMLRAAPNDRPTMAEACRALTAIGAGQSAAGMTPNAGPTVVTDTPPRPDVRAMSDPTVRTWQQPPPHQMPPRPAYAGMPPGRPRAGLAAMITPLWRKRLLTALAIVVAALIGILVANTFVDTSGNHAAADPGVLDQTASSEPTTTGVPTTTAAPATTDANQAALTTTPTNTQPGVVTPQAMLTVLRTYLGLLPQNTGQAWQLLTPAEQGRSGGLGGYQQTWRTVKSVEFGGAVPRGGDAVLARIKLTSDNGQSTDQFYNVQFVSQNGTVLINDFSVVGRPNKHG
jgi:eukaryotic-like serine/threonine-protein kinase